MGSTVNIESSGLPPNGPAEMLIIDRQVATGAIDNEGVANIEVAVPADATTGVQPLIVVAAGTAITADCVINLVATPAFDVPPSPLSGSTFTVTVGDPLTFPVQASDVDTGDVVTLGAVGVPSGANFPIPSPANPVASTFSWTPTADQVGGHVIVFTATDDTGLSAAPLSVVVNVQAAITIQNAKTKCGKDGKDQIRIGGELEGFDPSADLTLEIGSDPVGTFGPFGPLTIPAGARGPVEVDGGKVKVTLPKDGTGKFHINVDVNDLNDCTGEETEAELTLSLNSVSDTITLQREKDSKFRSMK